MLKYDLISGDWGWFLNFVVHGANSLFCLVDIFVSKRPVRFLHLYLPIAFGLYYMTFSLIYWAAGMG